VAEDLADDVVILQKAFAKAEVATPLHFVRDGEEAISYLKGEAAFADRERHPFPRMVLVDLKMPRLDGFGLLGWVRANEGLRRLPMVVFTSSEYGGDVNRAYDLGANSFVVKPTDFAEYQEVARTLENYWLKANRSPGVETPRPGDAVGRRYLLQSLETGKYAMEDGGWHIDPKEAISFDSLEEARQRAQGLQLTRAQVLVVYEGEGKAIRVIGGFQV
jgi:CheY-like chemotaxis protein